MGTEERGALSGILKVHTVFITCTTPPPQQRSLRPTYSLPGGRNSSPSMTDCPLWFSAGLLTSPPGREALKPWTLRPGVPHPKQEVLYRPLRRGAGGGWSSLRRTTR